MGSNRFRAVACFVWVVAAAIVLLLMRFTGHEVAYEPETGREDTAVRCRVMREQAQCIRARCVWCCGRPCWPGLAHGADVFCEEASTRAQVGEEHFARRFATAAGDGCKAPDATPHPPAPRPPATPQPTEPEPARPRSTPRRLRGPPGVMPQVGGFDMEFPKSSDAEPDLVGLAVHLGKSLAPFHFGYGRPATQPECTKPWGAAIPDTYMGGCVDGCRPRGTFEEARLACSREELCGGVVRVASKRYEMRSSGLHESQTGETVWKNPCFVDSDPSAQDVWDVFHDAVEVALADESLRLGEKHRPQLRRDESILISVASYRDPSCPALVRSAFKEAKHPERVSVAVVQQNCISGCRIGTGWADTRRVVPQQLPDVDCVYSFCESPFGRPHCDDGRVRILRLTERESYGPFFARYMATKQWRGEEFFVQVDAHSEFRPGWDDDIVAQIKRTPSYPASVISNYPPAHDLEWDDAVPAALCSCTFESVWDMPPIRMTARLVASPRSVSGDKSQPRHSAFVAAGFYAAHSSFLTKFDFDPFMPYLFMGEEIALSARFWTHGFDIYAPARNIVRHWYVRKEAMKFWESVDLVFSKGNMHNSLTHLITRRVHYLVGFGDALRKADVEPQSLLTRIDQFGLGTNRTLAAFHRVNGLDLTNAADLKSVLPSWCKRGELPRPE